MGSLPVTSLKRLSVDIVSLFKPSASATPILLGTPVISCIHKADK